MWRWKGKKSVNHFLSDLTRDKGTHSILVYALCPHRSNELVTSWQVSCFMFFWICFEYFDTHTVFYTEKNNISSNFTFLHFFLSVNERMERNVFLWKLQSNEKMTWQASRRRNKLKTSCKPVKNVFSGAPIIKNSSAACVEKHSRLDMLFNKHINSSI